MEEVKGFLKSIELVAKNNNYSFGPNRIVEDDGLVIQIYLNSHGLKIYEEIVPDPYDEYGSLTSKSVTSNDAKGLIPAIKKAFNSHEVLGSIKLFSVGASPSFLVKIGYPKGVKSWMVSRALSSRVP